MDAIDNSAGVDTSDQEVNLKILLGLAMDAGELDAAERDDGAPGPEPRTSSTPCSPIRCASASGWPLAHQVEHRPPGLVRAGAHVARGQRRGRPRGRGAARRGRARRPPACGGGVDPSRARGADGRRRSGGWPPSSSRPICRSRLRAPASSRPSHRPSASGSTGCSIVTRCAANSSPAEPPTTSSTGWASRSSTGSAMTPELSAAESRGAAGVARGVTDAKPVVG